MESKIVETTYSDTFSLPKRILGIDAQQNLVPQIAQLKKKLHIRSEKSALDCFLTTLGEVTAYPDPQKGWRLPAVKEGGRYVKEEPVDAIISTSCYSSHIVAGELKRKRGIPWVADFQDLWTQNHYYPYSRLRRAIERRLELRTLARADALVIAAGHSAQRMSELHKGKAVHTITNAFDSAEVNDPPAALTRKFTITYTGNIYAGRQSPEPLFMALRDLLAEGAIDAASFEVRFYGAEMGWIEKQAERHGLGGVVRQYGIVPREVALERQRESQLLLMLKWNDPAERGIYSSKIFEYLAAGRPVLAVGGYQDVVSELLAETGAGVDAPTPEDAKRLLRGLFEEYRRTGQVRYSGDRVEVNRYTWREVARRYAEILESVGQ
jgi:glycosyltransferase involved in cell wall biosynthesis